MSTISLSLREFAERYTAAWCSGNPAQVAGFYAPNGSLAINGGSPAVGREAISREAESFMTAFPDLKVVMDRLVSRGDRIEYHWTLTGTNTGPGGTGRRVRISGYESWQMDGSGLIAASEGQFDSEEYQRQLKGK